MIKLIAIGSDPEVFLVDENDKPVSAIGLIGGSKHEPLHIIDNFFLQEDNVMVEYNIPPVRDVDRFIFNLNKGLNIIKNQIPENLDIKITPSLEFSNDQLAHPQAEEFGCEPDFNVWKRCENPIINPENNYRYAGGHIHISYENPTLEVSEKLVKALDFFLGVPFVLIDKDEIRKRKYGTAGRFRIKTYGIEYRTLSNHWLSSDGLKEYVFNQVIEAINFVNNNQEVPDIVMDCINNNDKILALELLKLNNINVSYENVEYSKVRK